MREALERLDLLREEHFPAEQRRLWKDARVPGRGWRRRWVVFSGVVCTATPVLFRPTSCSIADAPDGWRPLSVLLRFPRTEQPASSGLARAILDCKFIRSR